ncbi:hypothetical protein OBV_24710 [Oscillibacter valericigenes Sjm18-20]|nr:hypothetical protein OBV_24710 [Oscillibacter valericigenes Sjm18-20]
MRSGGQQPQADPQGETVATFAIGCRRMYDYIDDNPAVEILPVDYTNNPAVIVQHPNFISVNAAVEVDFYGQVCAEFSRNQPHLGHRRTERFCPRGRSIPEW